MGGHTHDRPRCLGWQDLFGVLDPSHEPEQRIGVKSGKGLVEVGVKFKIRGSRAISNLAEEQKSHLRFLCTASLLGGRLGRRQQGTHCLFQRMHNPLQIFQRDPSPLNTWAVDTDRQPSLHDPSNGVNVPHQL